MNKTLLAMLLPISLLPSANLLAQEEMKPGLWEMTMKSDMMKQMPKISPEQMEQMRGMGIQIPQMQDGAMVTRVCITREMAARKQMPDMGANETGCQPKNHERSGSSYSVDIVCDGPHMKGEGKVEGRFSGGDSFTSTYDFNGTMHGTPVNQHHETSGKWISADCGNVPPLDVIPK
jgi:hypothetical protein